MYICKHCNKNVDFNNFKVFDLYIFHLDCLDVYKSDQERLLREITVCIYQNGRVYIIFYGFEYGSLQSHNQLEYQ